MLYELLVGHVPFFSDNNFSLMKKHLYEKIIPVRQYNSAISQKMENIITLATAKNPEERYSNVEKMIKDFLKIDKNINTKQIFLKHEIYKGVVNDNIPLFRQTQKDNYF